MEKRKWERGRKSNKNNQCVLITQNECDRYTLQIYTNNKIKTIKQTKPQWLLPTVHLVYSRPGKAQPWLQLSTSFRQSFSVPQTQHSCRKARHSRSNRCFSLHFWPIGSSPRFLQTLKETQLPPRAQQGTNVSMEFYTHGRPGRCTLHSDIKHHAVWTVLTKKRWGAKSQSEGEAWGCGLVVQRVPIA